MSEIHLREAEPTSRSIDVALAALAARQHGVVTRRQLRALGLGETAISKRVGAGRLHRLHRGVFAVGHTVLGARGQWLGAVLTCGPNALLSCAAAGALWGLRPSSAVLIDVTVPGSGTRARRPGLRIHRARGLSADERTLHDGIPVTTPSRTLLDLAAVLPRRGLERALDQAQVLRLFDLVSLDALAARHSGHHGAARLRGALHDHKAGTTLTRSELEERFLRLSRDHGLPAPAVNARVAGFEVDFLFAAHRIVVETDGWAFHGTRGAFERDHARDAALAARGYRTLRFTDRQLRGEPDAVARALHASFANARSAVWNG